MGTFIVSIYVVGVQRTLYMYRYTHAATLTGFVDCSKKILAVRKQQRPKWAPDIYQMQITYSCANSELLASLCD